MANKPITLAPLTGVLDVRSTPDLIPRDGVRFRQNLQTVADGKLRRGAGWAKLLSQAAYNNADFHDQLLVFDGIVVPVTEPFAYYKLDTATSLIVPDSIGSRDMTLDLAPPIIVGKLGNAYQGIGGGSSWQATRANADVDVGGVDFTVRMWFKMFANNGFMFEIFSSGTVLFEMQYNNVSSNMKIDVNISNGPGLGDFATASTSPLIPIETTTWHHIIAWHRTGVEIGVRLDNGAPVTTPFTLGLGAVDEMAIWSDGSADELAIWRGTVLTEAEQDADWNEGSGRTWPWETE